MVFYGSGFITRTLSQNVLAKLFTPISMGFAHLVRASKAGFVMTQIACVLAVRAQKPPPRAVASTTGNSHQTVRVHCAQIVPWIAVAGGARGAESDSNQTKKVSVCSVETVIRAQTAKSARRGLSRSGTTTGAFFTRTREPWCAVPYTRAALTTSPRVGVVRVRCANPSRTVPNTEIPTPLCV